MEERWTLVYAADINYLTLLQTYYVPSTSLGVRVSSDPQAESLLIDLSSVDVWRGYGVLKIN